MRPHFLHAQPALLFAGAAALGDLAHQADGRLRLFVITQLHNGVFSAAIFGEEHRRALFYIAQHLIVVSQVGDRFDIGHGIHSFQP